MATAYVENRSGYESKFRRYFAAGYVDEAITAGIPEGTLVYYDGATRTIKIADQKTATDAMGICYGVTNRDVRDGYTDNPTSNWMPRTKGGKIMDLEMIASLKVKESTFNFRVVDLQLTGTIAVLAGDLTEVVGTATAFTTELKVGDYIYIDSQLKQVSIVTDANHVTVSVAFSGAVAAASVAIAKGMRKKPVYLGENGATTKFGKLGLLNLTTLVPIASDGQSKMVGWIEDSQTIQLDLTMQLVATTL